MPQNPHRPYRYDRDATYSGPEIVPAVVIGCAVSLAVLAVPFMNSRSVGENAVASSVPDTTTTPDLAANALVADEREASPSPPARQQSVAQRDRSNLVLTSYHEDNGPAAPGEAAPKEMPALNWPKPTLALFCTGRQHGYIEPCGCTGLENAKGGLSRRHSLLTSFRKRGWDVLALDVGNQVRRYGPQAEIKLQTTANILRHMQYDAVGFGPDDLQLSIGELAVAIVGNGEEETPFTCANVDVLGMNSSYRIVERGGMKVGIVAVIGDELRAKINSTDINQRNAKQALAEVIQVFRRERCRRIILLAHANDAETREFAREFPRLDLIVTAAGAGEPTLEPVSVQGARAKIIQVGTKGMYVGLVGLYEGPPARIRYARIELDARFPDSQTVMENFALYQRQLQDLGLQGLGVRPVKHPSGREFVGHETCGDCHTEAYEVFEGTPHFHATDSIAEPTERSEIVRHFDPECLSCHVTGWDPQEYLPYVSGYLDYADSAALHSNGCENCHGPGSQHVAAENGDIDATEEELDGPFLPPVYMVASKNADKWPGDGRNRDGMGSVDTHESGGRQRPLF